jgi:zinc protease
VTKRLTTRRIVLYAALWICSFVLGITLAKATRAAFGGETEPPAAEAGGVFRDARAREVLERYIEATGGRAAHEAITSRVVKGTIDYPQQGISGTLEIMLEAPSSMRVEMSLDGMGEFVRGYDGEVAWEIGPNGQARRLDAEETDATRRRAMVAPALHVEELYESISYAGAAEVDGVACHALEFVSLGKQTETICYDAETGLEVQIRTAEPARGGPVMVTATFHDYEAFDGVRLNTRLVSNAGGIVRETRFTSIEHNEDLDDALFAPPASLAGRGAGRGPGGPD